MYRSPMNDEKRMRDALAMVPPNAHIAVKCLAVLGTVVTDYLIDQTKREAEHRIAMAQLQARHAIRMAELRTQHAVSVARLRFGSDFGKSE
jgi:hypothetical protein